MAVILTIAAVGAGTVYLINSGLFESLFVSYIVVPRGVDHLSHYRKLKDRKSRHNKILGLPPVWMAIGIVLGLATVAIIMTVFK